jgi:hypothetical protein
MTIIGLGALLALFAAGVVALARLARLADRDRRNQQEAEARRAALQARPRVLPPGRTNGRAHVHDWADWDL